MSDQLIISALKIETQIGVHNWEQRIRQPLLLDIIIALDVQNCNDDIANTVNYSSLCEDITHYVESNSFLLIETVAEQVAQRIKDMFHIEKITVTVSKPHAIKNAGNISITVNR